MHHWTASDIPSQTGRIAVVTGTGGLGFESALALARSGAQVIVAGRNEQKGREAINRIRQLVHDAKVRFERLDLASLGSIDAFSIRMLSALPRLDLLVNNAAVMTPPRREVTADGFELQLGTNYLGHFALTAQLLPLLQLGMSARVVSVSSIAGRNGEIQFDDLQFEQSYKPMHAYSQSKLACLMFALELQRRSDAAGWGIQSVAAHPGIARTELLLNGAGPWSAAGMMRRFFWFLFQPAARGALPTLFAATASQAEAAGYYGPDRLGEVRGHPGPATFPAQALDGKVAARLWIESERLTGTSFRALVKRLPETTPAQLDKAAPCVP